MKTQPPHNPTPRSELDALHALDPPRELWDRIERRLDEELPSTAAGKRSATPSVPPVDTALPSPARRGGSRAFWTYRTRFAIAAALFAAAAVGVTLLSNVAPEATGRPLPSQSATELAVLMERSQLLERRLASLPPQSVRETTAGALRLRIAYVDQSLSALPATGEVSRHRLWQRRVNLLESLLAVESRPTRQNPGPDPALRKVSF